MSAPATIARPELTLPEAEAALLRGCYERAASVLEYGSGGSTLLAAESGAEVWAVESDRDWAAMMEGWFAANPTKGRAEIVHADIGPTRDWGHPVDEASWRTYARYPLAIWDRAGFAHPDVVLVDGRFRLGCALATLFRAKRPVTLLFDDYAPRKGYHRIEEFLGAPRMTDRMARFEITPRPVPPDRLLRVVEFMTRP